MKHRAVITTQSGSTYIWSPGRDVFHHVDDSIEMMDLDVPTPPTVGQRFTVYGDMWRPEDRRWIPGSRVVTSVVADVVWEPDWTCVGGSRGPVRTWVPEGV